MSAQPSTLEDSPFIIEHNNRHRLSQIAEQQYLNAKRNGSIAAALGPPLHIPRLQQVPQDRYKAPQSFHETVQPIEFHVSSVSPSGERSILLPLRLADVVGEYTSMPNPDRADDLVSLGDHRTKATMRVHIKGVIEPIIHDLSINSLRAHDLRFSLIEIARKVAKAIQDIIGTGVWRLGNGDTLCFKDLYLVELRHVTKGSFQPVLAYFPASLQKDGAHRSRG